MRKRHRIILLALAGAALAVGVLRELGFVNLSHYTLHAQSHASHQSETDRYSEVLANSTNLVVASNSDSSFAHAVKAELEQQLKTKPGVNLAISVNRIDVDGWYWLPLFKTGHSVFQLQVRVAEGNAIRDTAISGELEFTVKGLCSILTLKQVLAKKIVQDSMDYIKQ